MKDVEHIRKRIADSGLKVTVQRLAVLEALFDLKNHPTVERIRQKINERYPGIASGTIYKTLETFVDKGLVEKVKDSNDKMRYDAYTEKHHHLYSEDDQEIGDYYDPELDKLLEEYFRKKSIPGFDVHDTRVQIVGRFKK